MWQHLLYGTVAAKPGLSWSPGRETWCVAKCRPHSLKALHEVQLCQILSHLELTFLWTQKDRNKEEENLWRGWSRSAMWLMVSGLRFQQKQWHLVADRSNIAIEIQVEARWDKSPCQHQRCMLIHCKSLISTHQFSAQQHLLIIRVSMESWRGRRSWLRGRKSNRDRSQVNHRPHTQRLPLTLMNPTNLLTPTLTPTLT